MGRRIVSASELTYPALAELFERGFAGYVVPIHTTAAQLEARNRIEHVDLCASAIAIDDGEPVALALVARRGRRCRLAAMGVVERVRGRGVGRALVDTVLGEARDRGDAEMVLECVATNHAALRLYERAGFAITRRLVGWRAGALAPAPAPLVEIDPAALGREAARADSPPGAAALSWQLAPETLVGMTWPLRGFMLDDAAFAVVAVTPFELVVRAVFTRPAQRGRGRAADLLRALAAAFAPLPLVMPPIIPDGLGARLAARLGLAPHELGQLELACTL